MCDITVTAEQGDQIALRPYSTLSRDACLRKAFNSFPVVSTIVYCPDEKICGLELEPEKTSALTVGQNRTCKIYAEDLDLCSQLIISLVNSGMYFLSVD